jgi:hypothetical protein
MNNVLAALWPLFALIVAGFYAHKRGLLGEGFWPGAEKLNYFVLFPSLLLHSLATAPLHNPALPRLLGAVSLMLGLIWAGLLLMRRVRRWPASRFGVLLQGTVRFNTYLGLAIVSSLYGKDSLLLAAVMLALLVPAVNVMSVLALTSDRHPSARTILLPLVKNPLILACLIGILLNLAGIELRGGVDRLVALLATTSLPLGLLCVGAALRPAELHGELPALLSNSLIRLLAMPALAWACAHLLKLPAIESTLLVLFFALPTAPTAYVLTSQLGGNSHLMAGIITLQTLACALSLMVVLTIAG